MMRSISVSNTVMDVLYNLLFVLSAIELAGMIFIEVVGDTVEIRAKRAFSNLCKVVVHLFIAVRIRGCVKDFINHMLPCQDLEKRPNYMVKVS